MPLLRYNVATTLDGFIASPDHATDWIVEDPSVDFDALYAQFDTFLMGRKTYETMARYAAQSGADPLRGRDVLVVSTTMAQDQFPDVTVLAGGHLDVIRQRKAAGSKDIWLMGGGGLAQECLDAGLLDAVEVAVMPVAIGDGIKMIAPSKTGTAWRLEVEQLDKLDSGILMIKYRVAAHVI